jgi:hypothetical protein
MRFKMLMTWALGMTGDKNDDSLIAIQTSVEMPLGIS